MNSALNPAILGTWSGSLDLDGVPVPIVLRIAAARSGISVIADFPTHYRSDVAMLDALFEDSELRFATRNMGRYIGRLGDAGHTIDGAFDNNGQRYALVLSPGVVDAPEPKRPQTPMPPFPYAIESVRIPNTSARAVLAGALTLPDGAARAAMLLVTGSGAMDRDETVFGHKPFWVLADFLTRHGCAVLRLDDRGVGESSGERGALTQADEVEDMGLALDFLRRHDTLRQVPMGMIGHSMGALVAMRAAACREDVAFVISMAGPGIPLGEAFVDRECRELEKKGMDAAAVARHGDFTRALYRGLGALEASTPIDSPWIVALAERHGALDSAVIKDSADWIARLNQPWFRSVLAIDPADFLRRLKIPFLAINGSLDTQVGAQRNLAAIDAALDASGNADHRSVELPNLNHLFQTATTGLPYEYPSIEETIAPLALATLREWLDARFPSR